MKRPVIFAVWVSFPYLIAENTDQSSASPTTSVIK